MKFDKYEATGNSFILVDARDRGDVAGFVAMLREKAKDLCDCHYGMGADGILILGTGQLAPSVMHIINADGSIARMCGNGLRCMARFIDENALAPIAKDGRYAIETLGGLQRAAILERTREAWVVEIEIANVEFLETLEIEVMGQDGRLKTFKIHVMDVGNPHAVIFADEDVNALALEFGQVLSTHSAFIDGINVEFIQETQKGSIAMAVYERGVGITLACGTGAVATAAVYAKTCGQKMSDVTVQTQGGALKVMLPDDVCGQYRLSGGVRRVFSKANVEL